MASRTSRKEWVRGLPWAFGVGRQDCKRLHWASERSVGYGFLIGESVRNHPNLHLTKQALRGEQVAVLRLHATSAGHVTKAAYSCLRRVYVLHDTKETPNFRELLLRTPVNSFDPEAFG
jgi:hypothetical protein